MVGKMLAERMNDMSESNSNLYVLGISSDERASLDDAMFENFGGSCEIKTVNVLSCSGDGSYDVEFSFQIPHGCGDAIGQVSKVVYNAVGRFLDFDLISDVNANMDPVFSSEELFDELIENGDVRIKVKFDSEAAYGAAEQYPDRSFLYAMSMVKGG